MSLTLASLLAGLFLLLVGLGLFLFPDFVRRGLTAFPRSKLATLVLLAATTAIILLQVSQLGEADFGKYKNYLFAFFLALSIGSWFFVPDFLGVRSLCALGLILAVHFRSAAYLQPPESRLFLVTFVYVGIVICLYLAASPFRFRDAVTKVSQSQGLRRSMGAGLTLYGVLLCILSLSY